MTKYRINIICTSYLASAVITTGGVVQQMVVDPNELMSIFGPMAYQFNSKEVLSDEPLWFAIAAPAADRLVAFLKSKGVRVSAKHKLRNIVPYYIQAGYVLRESEIRGAYGKCVPEVFQGPDGYHYGST